MKNTVESARKFLESKGCTDTGTLRLCSTMEGGTVAEWMVEYAEQFKGVSLTAEEQVLKAIKEGKTGEKFWKEIKKIQEEGIFKDENFMD